MKKLNSNEFLGKQFHFLKAIKEKETRLLGTRKTRMILCKCNCGKETIVQLPKLLSGHTRSCGCLKKECKTNLIHGLTKHPLHRVWSTMMERCNNPHSKSYKDYGGRGITVCDEWIKDFKIFYDWSIENGWRKGLEINRKENDGNYCPINCNYVTEKENSRNRRSTRWVFVNEEKISLAEAVERKLISRDKFYKNESYKKQFIKQ